MPPASTVESLGLSVFTEESVIKVTRPPAGALPETQKKGDEGEVVPSPFIISESLYPIQTKVVSKIWGLKYYNVKYITINDLSVKQM